MGIFGFVNIKRNVDSVLENGPVADPCLNKNNGKFY